MDLCILEILHWITLLLYVLVFFKTLFLFPKVKNCPHNREIGWVIYSYLTCLLIMTGVFSYLQVEWVVSGYDGSIDYQHALLWTIYDISNVLVKFFFMLGLEVLLKWKCVDSHGNVCLRRRKEDV
jgi:hypothetical protein